MTRVVDIGLVNLRITLRQQLLQSLQNLSVPAWKSTFAKNEFVVFVFVGWVLYGTPLNNYDNTAEGWDWDFVDCLYFTMATLTTVGYGDHPRLSQAR